jgi:hypothetical protein
VLAKIDDAAGVALLDVIKSANFDDPISRNSDRTIVDGRSVHCHHSAPANDHL